MIILGISAYYHDSAAALIIDGDIVSAIQEERLTRKKQDSNFPINAINECLSIANINVDDLDIVVFYDKPLLKFERILETYLAFSPLGIKSFIKAIPLWLKKKLWIKDLIAKELGFTKEILFTEHHESHAASAFFPSPYQESAFLTIDGVGEWATTSYGVGKDNEIDIIGEIHFPHSLGLLYSAFTYYTGFKVNSGEYKVMGLAPYGKPIYKDLILEKLIDVKDDGSFRMNLDYFDYCAGLTMTNDKFSKLFGAPPRKPESNLTQNEMDLARSIQDVTEEIMLKMANHIHNITGQKYLCLAGGVALNCVGNGRILRESPFQDIWIQPAAGDAGGSLGAALLIWYQHLNNERKVSDTFDLQKGSYLGPKYDNDVIRKFLDEIDAKYIELEDKDIPDRVADLIKSDNVVGWFQGRMEFGPRALGARSILGNPKSPKMQEIMNKKIKFRESFRPFAPSVIEDDISTYFELDRPSPYMLLVAPVTKSMRLENNESDNDLFGLEKLYVQRSKIPAVTHVDYSARIQSVSKKTNKLYYELLSSLKNKDGDGLVINTSFNVRGEPIICTPNDAYTCFMRTNMDYLVLGNFLLNKNDQNEFTDLEDWRSKYELD